MKVEGVVYRLERNVKIEQDQGYNDSRHYVQPCIEEIVVHHE